MRTLIAAILCTLFALGANAEPITHPTQTEKRWDPMNPDGVYYLVIVTYCPKAVETALVPMNQGHSYNDEVAPTIEERKAALKGLGCRDEPIPPEWMTQEMTPDKFIYHGGAQAAMEWEQKHQELKGWVVGMIQLKMSEHPIIGAVSQ